MRIEGKTVPSTVLEIAEPQCVAEEFDGEIVAINLDTGLYFSMKSTSALVWHELVAGRSIESLLRSADRAEMAEAVRQFVSDLQEGGLMRISTRAEVEPHSGSTSLPMTELPRLESYGDMQSLLLLDPVHEVEQDVGWPKIRGA
jgi:hypothetical protein